MSAGRIAFSRGRDLRWAACRLNSALVVMLLDNGNDSLAVGAQGAIRTAPQRYFGD